MVNLVLRDTILEVMGDQTPTLFNLQLFLRSETDGTFEYFPDQIDTLVIEQNFIGMTNDVLYIKFPVSPADYAVIYKQYNGLLATLIITYVDVYGSPAVSVAPVVKQYRATIVNPVDIQKKIHDSQLRITPDMNMEIQLIEEQAYDVLRARINGLYTSTTLTDCIRHIAVSQGITSVEMVPLENTHTYDHILIPPYKSFADVFGYLQRRYGCYSTGLNYYLTNGTLFIYPPFDTDPNASTEYTIRMYLSEKGDFAGCHSYHDVSGNVISLVTTTHPEIVDHTVAGSENEGTAFMFLRSSKLVDGVIHVDNTNGPAFTDDVGMTVKLNNTKQVGTGYQNVTYAKSTDNPFAHMSRLAASQAVIMHASWIHPKPFLIPPGSPISYSYDSAGTVATQNGIVEGLICQYNRGPQGAAGYIFQGVGQLTLRLSPNATTSSGVVDATKPKSQSVISTLFKSL